MKKKLAFIIMRLGLCIVVGTPIIDIGLALNGIMLPGTLMWIICIIGVSCLGLGAVSAIDTVKTL